jgi:hypothetical protein
MSAQPLSAQLSHPGWTRRMREDRARAILNQTPEQRAITVTVMTRALELGAEGLALTGSTARRRRTIISDLDYHVIGRRPDLSDLPGDIDVIATSAERLRSQLIEGDDFVQWTLRYGCILYDTGVMREGVRLIVDEQLWPSSDRKLRAVADHRREVERLIAMGDRDAAQEQTRATLTTAARGLLLETGVFPLARSELPGQLKRAGYAPLAEALAGVIYEAPGLADLAAAVALLDVARNTYPARSAA